MDNFFSKRFFDSRGQGTIEYIMIVAVVVVVSLIVVSLVSNQTNTVSSVSSNSQNVSLKTAGIGVGDSVAGEDGNLLFIFQNNLGERATVTKITINETDYNFNNYLAVGDKKSFVLNGVAACTGDKKEYSVVVRYMSENGLEKSLNYGNVLINCVSTVSPIGIFVEACGTGCGNGTVEEGSDGGDSNVGGVEFTKADYATGNSAKDCITANVCITRGDKEGLYNSVTDEGYTSNPGDTEWYFGGVCENGLLFAGWIAAVRRYMQSSPPEVLGVPACLHLISDDEYYDINFTSWTGHNAGGGFSYTRQRADSIIQWQPPVDYNYFSKADYATGDAAKDCITPKVCITRGNIKGLYNSVTEAGYDEEDPYGNPGDTEWSFSGYCADVSSFSKWVDAVEGYPPERLGVPGCLHLISDNEYYNILFNGWSAGNSVTSTGGGGFSYYRKQVEAP